MLTPNASYKINGVTVNEHIIPDGTRWKDATKAKKAGFAKGDLYKKQKPLSGTGAAKYVTVHNTNDLAGTYEDAEQYVRATVNENMNSSRVHFYVDDVNAWQELRAGTGMCANDPKGSAEVSWHAGDGSAAAGGNMTSLSIEIIMGDTTARDAKAKDNGARLSAWLLHHHGLGIDRLVTHTYWVNKSAGKSFSDVDEQCCNLISGKKWCPSYIFASYNKDTAAKNWKAFKALVKQYLDQLNGAETTPAEPTEPAEPAVKWYRVRKSWADEKSQLGAFLSLEHAKLACAAGYTVYDWNGNAVYSKAKDAAKAETKVDPAKSFNKAKAGTYKVKSSDGLNLRTGASTAKQIIEAMPDGAKVKCYGYYTGAWLYVVSPSGAKGFCHSGYLVKA